MPILRHTQITTGDVLRHASERTGMLSRYPTAHLMTLTPNWRQKAVPTRESKGNLSVKELPEVKSPLLPARTPQRRFLTYSEDDRRFNETLFEAHKFESLFSQCTNKYVDLINKEGYTLRGTLASQAVEFLKARLYWLSAVTKRPIETVVKESTHDLMQFGNFYLVKQREDQITLRVGGRVLRSAVGLHGDPALGVITGYFRADPITFFPRYDKDTGRHIGWQQKILGKEPKDFTLEEVIHVPLNRSAGEVLGTSMYAPVIDDVRGLRNMEEYVMKLIQKHLFPYLQHIIPDNVGDGHGTEEDMREAVYAHVNVAPDGMIFTPPGHKIEAVETVNATLDYEPALKHMLQRVLMGLGLSEAIMGIGNSAVGMSDMLTVQMHDRVKSIQQDVERALTLLILTELLIEAGFDPLTRVSDRVELEFNEIEMENVVRMQNHAGNMYGLGGLTQDEFRHELKLNPLTDKQRELLQWSQDKVPFMEAQIEAELASQIEVLKVTHELDLDLATHQSKLSQDASTQAHEQTKDLATHNAKMGIQTANNQASLATNGKPAPAPAPTPGQLRAPKMASKGTHLGLNPAKKASGGSTAGAVANKDSPANQHGSRGAPRFSRTPAAGITASRRPKSAN